MGGDTKGMWPETLSTAPRFQNLLYFNLFNACQGSAAKIWAEFYFKLVKQLLQACHAAFNAEFCKILQHIWQIKIALKLHFLFWNSPKSISAGASSQTLQGTYSAPHTPICWRRGISPSFNFLAKLPIFNQYSNIQLKHQVCLHLTMPLLRLFRPWEFGHLPFAPTISWFLHSLLGLATYWRMCTIMLLFLFTYSLTAMRIMRSHNHMPPPILSIATLDELNNSPQWTEWWPSQKERQRNLQYNVPLFILH